MPDWAIPENIHTPLRTTLNWILKNFRISKNDSSRFCRIPNLADSKYWGIPDFAKLIMIFVEFRSKFTTFWGNSWISSQAYQAFSTGFPMSSMGGAWIFSGIAHYKNKRTKKVQTRAHKGTAEKRTEYEILKSQSQKTHASSTKIPWSPPDFTDKPTRKVPPQQIHAKDPVYKAPKRRKPC